MTLQPAFPTDGSIARALGLFFCTALFAAVTCTNVAADASAFCTTKDPCPRLAADDGTSKPQSSEGWRLVRTPNPTGGPEAIAITHVADFARSDPDLAGLMFRCSEYGIEGLIVLIAPLPPQAHPSVRIAAGANELKLTATMVAPFSSILLTEEATALITGPWLSRSELDVIVEHEGVKTAGVILLAGLPKALPSLAAECKSRRPASPSR